jgi:hypothetical protein
MIRKRRLCSAVRQAAAEDKWGRSAEHNFRGINTCAGACVSPHIQPVPPNPKFHQQPTQYPRLLFQKSRDHFRPRKTAKCVVESRIYCSRFEAAAFLCSLGWGTVRLCRVLAIFLFGTDGFAVQIKSVIGWHLQGSRIWPLFLVCGQANAKLDLIGSSRAFHLHSPNVHWPS